MLVNYHRHRSFFYIPQDIDIKNDGTYGLRCHPKHRKAARKLKFPFSAPPSGIKPGLSALQASE